MHCGPRIVDGRTDDGGTLRLTRLSALVILLVLLGAVDAALAWGPATHIGLARTVIENLGLLPVGVAALIARHISSYIYGSIAADIVFAKRLSRVKQFCHHWSTGFRVLESAPDEASRAFAMGYLSHLAADTVAHGKYVPRQIAMSRGSVNLGHLYWELRADAMEKAESWRLLDELRTHDHGHHHALLSQHITSTFLPYGLNRLVFDGINAMTARQTFRRTMDQVGRYSRWPLSSALLQAYRDESVDRILAVLATGESSSILREDPNGTSAFMQLRANRRDLRRLVRLGGSGHARRWETSQGWAPCTGTGWGEASTSGDWAADGDTPQSTALAEPISSVDGSDALATTTELAETIS